MGNALYDFYSLVEFYQKTHSFAALSRSFSDTIQLVNKIVRAHFPWSNLYKPKKLKQDKDDLSQRIENTFKVLSKCFENCERNYGTLFLPLC